MVLVNTAMGASVSAFRQKRRKSRTMPTQADAYRASASAFVAEANKIICLVDRVTADYHQPMLAQYDELMALAEAYDAVAQKCWFDDQYPLVQK